MSDFVYRETHLDRIVAVGWGGRFAFANVTEIDGGHDQIFIHATEFGGTAEPPVLGAVAAVGQDLREYLAAWNADAALAGVLSIDVAGAARHGQLGNFRRLKARGKDGVLIGVASSGQAPARQYSIEFKIFSGGTLTVGGIVGRHPHFALAGGTVHFTEIFTVTLSGSASMARRFNQDGFV